MLALVSSPLSAKLVSSEALTNRVRPKTDVTDSLTGSRVDNSAVMAMSVKLILLLVGYHICFARVERFKESEIRELEWGKGKVPLSSLHDDHLPIASVAFTSHLGL